MACSQRAESWCGLCISQGCLHAYVKAWAELQEAELQDACCRSKCLWSCHGSDEHPFILHLQPLSDDNFVALSLLVVVNTLLLLLRDILVLGAGGRLLEHSIPLLATTTHTTPATTSRTGRPGAHTWQSPRPQLTAWLIGHEGVSF